MYMCPFHPLLEPSLYFFSDFTLVLSSAPCVQLPDTSILCYANHSRFSSPHATRIPVAYIDQFLSASYLVAYFAQAVDSRITRFNYVLPPSVITLNPTQPSRRRGISSSAQQLYNQLLAQLVADTSTDITQFVYDVTITSPSPTDIMATRTSHGNTIIVFNALLSISEYTIVEVDNLDPPYHNLQYNTTTFYFDQVIRLRVTIPVYYAVFISYAGANVAGTISPFLTPSNTPFIAIKSSAQPALFFPYHLHYHNPIAESSKWSFSTTTIILIAVGAAAAAAAILIYYLIRRYRRKLTKRIL